MAKAGSAPSSFSACTDEINTDDRGAANFSAGSEYARSGVAIEITGREDLFIDGEVHGKIRLHGGKLTIGPESRVTAEIEAQEVVVRGEVKGNIRGHNRVRIAATGRVIGPISTPLISIEEGAEVHGLRVNLEKEERPRPADAADSRPDKKVQVPVAQGVSRVHV